MDGEEENVGPFRRTSARTRRMATRMASALASSDNRTQVVLRIGGSFPIPNPSILPHHRILLFASPFLRLDIIGV
jgi:hypothetical protein